MSKQGSRDESSHELHRTVSRLLSSAASLDDLARRVLEAICVGEGWPFASFWERDDAARVLRCACIWHRPHDTGLAELGRMTEALTFSKGLGAPGRAWLIGEPQVVENICDEHSFQRRALALRAGLRSAIVFPLMHEGEVFGVIDLIGRVPPGDREIEGLFVPLGARLGEFLARMRAADPGSALSHSHAGV